MIRRHRWLVAAGVAITLPLVVLSIASVSASGIQYRTPETWSNDATLLITEPGFPEGRTASTDVSRFAALVDLYAAFATSDAVVARLRREGLITQEQVEAGSLPISAEAIPSKAAVAPTPLLTIVGKASSAEAARKLTTATTKALLATVASQQAAAGIGKGQRTVLRVLRAGSEPTLVEPRSMTLPIVIFLAGITGSIAAAFIRENSRRGPGASQMSRLQSQPLVPDLAPAPPASPEVTAVSDLEPRRPARPGTASPTLGAQSEVRQAGGRPPAR